MQEQLKKGICKSCQQKAIILGEKGRLEPRLLNKDDLCIFCEREKKGFEPQGRVVKNIRDGRRYGVEIFSRTGRIDDNIEMASKVSKEI